LDGETKEKISLGVKGTRKASFISQASRCIAMKIGQDNKLREKIRKIENKFKLSRMKTLLLCFSRKSGGISNDKIWEDSAYHSPKRCVTAT
jgi:hypothetical protein